MKHLILLAGAVAAFASASQGAQAASRPAVAITVRGQDGSAPANVSVVVRDWRRPEVGVDVKAEHGRPEDLQVNVTRGATTTVDATYVVHRYGFLAFFNRDKYSLTVHVPAGTALNVTNGIGGVTIDGNIFSVRAETGNGGIHVQAGTDVVARTGNGGVDVTIPSGAPPHVDIRTGNGGIDLKLPAGTRTRVEAHTGNGGIDNPLASGNGAGSIVLRTGNGGIGVTVAH